MKVWAIGLGALVVALAYVVTALLVNRNAVPVAGLLHASGSTGLRPAGLSLTVLNWNLGYGGLGKEADFGPDGGTRYFPESRQLVEKNLSGIVQVLKNNAADVYTLQEITTTSPLNFQVPMWDAVTASRPRAANVFVHDLVSAMVPWPWRLEHGLATLSEVEIASAESRPLPLEPGYWLGFIRKLYTLVVCRLPIANDSRRWVVVNLHHAAYDAKASTRQQQVEAVVSFAKAEFEKGNLVVLAGDWNMLLTDKQFHHDTDPKNLDWAHQFPRERLPPEWQLVTDLEVPTVRQLDRPYKAGQNYVTMIDGFLVSPNVAIESVRALDLGFEFSDHQPVIGRFRAR